MANNLLNIDDHYLKYPKDRWGGTDLNNPDMVNPWLEIQDIVNPKNVVEIGMWAGHSALLMMNVFKNLESLCSYDPHIVSQKNAKQIKKYYPQFTFYNEPIWNNEYRHKNIDIVFVDGDHGNLRPSRDLISTMKIKPRYIVVDNIEHHDVRQATKMLYNLWSLDYDPKFYFYTNVKYTGSVQSMVKAPSIMGLFKMENKYDTIKPMEFILDRVRKEFPNDNI